MTANKIMEKSHINLINTNSPLKIGAITSGIISEETDLDVLKVITKLEVGPIKVDKNRIVATYTIMQNNKEYLFQLIYKYEEDVFDPLNPESINLASMIAAQIAINYGLFCDEIVLKGFFDKTDRRFIKEMAKNTAREIFVKKFLEHNPFIIGNAARLRPMKQQNYLQAKIIFSDQNLHVGDKSRKSNNKPGGGVANKNQYAILSSGGKDSLLSYGLLREYGVQIHPIFINESGRHWFTALNAYRYFAENVPNTARVWTNADRIFTWILRHLPFVRKDFANLRSDEYPIRLWTVALLIFGALPLARKRGIDYLIIGDEFDTTIKLSYEGIIHYNGLYDQSRYFDDVMSLYYKQKGWGIIQFSPIRQLSEILIEKILMERYPRLQALQVSCHATHLEDGRVRPCGKCEKCRRIIGMLTAIDADPVKCGYTLSQIESALGDLEEKGVSQEKEAIQHLGYLLKQRDLINKSSLGSIPARKRQEIMKLRFDKIKSPINGIPVKLRSHLYHIFLEHSDGAVRRLGRVWQEFNPLTTLDLFKPYSFESKEFDKQAVTVGKILNLKNDKKFILGNLTWLEAQEHLKKVDIALLPVGSIEQHGAHLPLDIDSFDAEFLAQEVAKACTEPRPLVLPLIPYGVSYHHEDFSGTISISPKTLSSLVYEVGISVAKHGVNKLVIINGHGGNTPSLQFAAQMINRDASIFTCVETGETSETDVIALTETPNDVHAGEIETSTTLAIRPEVVRSGKANRFIPRFSSRYLNFSSKRSVEWYARTVKISKTGVLGDPTKASSEKGKKMWSMIIARLVEFVEDLKNMSLKEIYQRRY